MKKWIVASFCFLSGCIVGPRYSEPEVTFATHYSETEESKGEQINLKVWWTQFNDPILDSMIDEAIDHNYDLKIALERIAEVRARYHFASSNLFPEVDINGTAIRERVSQALFETPFSGPPVQNLFVFGFDASWELDLFGKLRNLKNAAMFDLEASQENFRNVYITLLAEVSRNYSLFRSMQKRMIATLEQIRVAESRALLSQVRFDAGLRSGIEPLQVSSELDALRATLPPLEAQKNEALYSLATLLGRQPEDIPQDWLLERPIPQAMGKIPIGIPSDLLRRRPDIRSAERRLAAATSRIGAAMALLFPTFSLRGSFGYQADDLGQLFTKEGTVWSYGPNVFWPLLDFGRIRSEIDFTKSAQREALFNYEKTVLKALEEVENALATYSKEEIRLQNLKKQLAALRLSRDLIADKYRAGLDSYSNLLDADAQVLFAEQTVISSEQNLSENLMAVYKSLGGDWSCANTP